MVKDVKLSNKQMLSRQPVVRPHPAIAADENDESGDASLPSTANTVQRSTLVEKKEHAINADALLEALSQYSERSAYYLIDDFSFTFEYLFLKLSQ